MSFHWSVLEGRAVDRNVVLGAFIRELRHGAEFTTADGTGTVWLIPASDPAAEIRMARWSEAASLSHPNLLEVRSAGAGELGDLPVVYCVMEPVEDRLSELLPTRALTSDEARDVVAAAASALEYLHARGLAHRAVDVDHVVAAEGRVKLVPDTVTAEGSIARDIRDLGATIVEILTQRRTHNAHEVPRTVPSPWRQIAAGCLEPDQALRWNISEVLAALEGRMPERAVAQPVVDATRETPPGSSPRSAFVWIAVAAVAAVILLVWFLRTPEPAAVVTTPVPEPAALPAPAAKDLPRQAPAPRVDQPVLRSRASGEWGIVAAAYRDYDAAEKRARIIADRWPGFQPEVFPEKGKGRKYYVLLGSSLSRDAAQSLLRKAHAAGLPRDAYVTKIAR